MTKFIEIYGAKLIGKNLCNFSLKGACKLENKKFDFVGDFI